MEQRQDLTTHRSALLFRAEREIRTGKYGAAACALEGFLQRHPEDREAWLYQLLAKIKLHGVGAFAKEIDRIEEFVELKETERWIVRQIFFVLYDDALNRGDHERALFCQTSLKELFSGSSISATAGIAEIERLIQEKRYPEVLTALQSHPRREAPGIELRLYRLFASVKVHSCAGHEREINEFIKTEGLSGKQREILRQIFVLGFEEARKENREDKAWVYQRLARRLVLGEPLGQVGLSSEQPVPIETAPATSPERREEPVAKALGDSVLRRRGEGQMPRHVSLLLLAAVVVMTAVGVVTYESGEVSQSTPALPAPRQSQPAPVAENIALISEAGDPRVAAATEEKSPPVPQHEIKAARATKKTVAKKARVIPQKKKVPERPAKPPRRERVKESEGTVRIRAEVPLRGEPRFGAPGLEVIESGSIVHVLGTRGDWLEVRSQSGGVTGYVRREFALPTQSEPRP
ncbi:MAG: SH3 domain-containing protein [Candidatus Binatia bacterium]